MTRAVARTAGAVPRATRWRVLVTVILVGLLPWSVQSFVGGAFLLRFLWGAVSAGGGFVPSADVSVAPRLSVSLLTDYPLFAGPPLLLQWVFAAVFWTLALLSAAGGLLDAEDPRVTAGLLALAGFSNLAVALEFGVQPERSAYPVGTLALWAVAAWRYWSWRTVQCRS